MNELGAALKSIYHTTHGNDIAINSLNYARIFLLTLAEIDHRLNQLQHGLRKLEFDVSTI